MKIKQKKQLNLPQLIEYAWENDMRNKNFESEGGAMVYFDYDGNLTCARGFVPQDFFTITTEEEIKEDTEFKELICLDVDDKYNSYDNVCVLDFDDDRVRAIYIPNDDLTLTLIWRDGKLVE